MLWNSFILVEKWENRNAVREEDASSLAGFSAVASPSLVRRMQYESRNHTDSDSRFQFPQSSRWLVGWSNQSIDDGFLYICWIVINLGFSREQVAQIKDLMVVMVHGQGRSGIKVNPAPPSLSGMRQNIQCLSNPTGTSSRS